MAWTEMYPAAHNSVPTELAEAIGIEEAAIAVAEADVLPAGPNIATLGDGDDAELVRYAAIEGGVLVGCERGYGGSVCKAWDMGTPVYRAYTVADHQGFIDNIRDLDGRLEADALGRLLLDALHPVGSIYMSAVADDPAGLFGGEWARWGQGRVPVGVDGEDTDFDEPGKIGGEKAHALTGNENGQHGHAVNNAVVPTEEHRHDFQIALFDQGYAAVSSSAAMGNLTEPTRGGAYRYSTGQFSGSAPGDSKSATVPTRPGQEVATVMRYTSIGDTNTPSATKTVSLAQSGAGAAHNNLQPYITCYMWKRVA